MAGNKVLLDTNIISALLKGEYAVADHIDKAAEVHLSSIVLGELWYGAAYSTKVKLNTAHVLLIASTYNVYSINDETAIFYGQIKAELRKRGTPIPENDIWIASTAIQHKLKLSTRDKHFQYVSGLQTLEW